MSSNYTKTDIEVVAEKMMLNHHGIMNGYSMDYCREIVIEIIEYLEQINSNQSGDK